MLELALAVGVGGAYWAHARAEGVAPAQLSALAGAMLGYALTVALWHSGFDAAWRIALGCAWLALAWVDWVRRTVHDLALIPLALMSVVLIALRGGDGAVLAFAAVVGLALWWIARGSRGKLGVGDVLAFPVAALSLGEIARVWVLIPAVLFAAIWAQIDRERGAPLLTPVGVAVALGVLV